VTPRLHVLTSSTLAAGIAAGIALFSLPAAAERPLPEWPSWEAIRLIELGEGALLRHEFSAAVRLAERAVELRPGEAQTWAFLARTGLRARNWPRAQTASGKWLALAPKDPQALFFAAQARFLSEQVEAAIPLFRRLADQSADDPAGPLGLALCAARQGDWSAMEEQLQEAQRRAPDLLLASLPLEEPWSFLAASQEGLEVLDRVLSAP